MKHLKTPQQLNEAQENLNISDVMNSSFSCDVYITDGGLGYSSLYGCVDSDADLCYVLPEVLQL